MNFAIAKEKIFDFITALLIAFYAVLSLILELKLFDRIEVNRLHIMVTGLFIILFSQRKIKIYPLSYRVGSTKLFSISHRVQKTYFLALILFFFVVLNSFFVRPQILFGAMFNLLMGVVIGKHLGLNKFTSKILLFPFWFLLTYIIVRLFENINPNEVFIRSRNYISFFLVITVLPYYFVRINFKRQISVFPAFLTLILSLFSLGRSGIISASVLFIGVILASEIKRRTKKIIGFLLLFLFVLSFNFYLQNYSALSDFERIVDISDWNKLGGRSTFWKNYFNNLDVFSFIFGMDLDTFKILNIGGTYLPGHVHSSILNFISVVGIGSLLFFTLLFKKIKNAYQHNLPIVFLFSALILRIFSETGCLFGYFDFVVWMFFFVKTDQNIIVKT